MRYKTIAYLLFILPSLGGCGDECREYSKYSCKQLENSNYNVYFYYPGGKEVYLGVSEKLSQCGDMAHGFASNNNLSGNTEWGYICCLKSSSSECEEKHR